MNSHDWDDNLPERYRGELALGPEARARTLRKLQERIAGGELPKPETDVSPPQLSAARGLSGLQLGLAGAALGVTASVVVWVALGTSLRLSAAEVRPRTAAAEAPRTAAAERALVARERSALLAQQERVVPAFVELRDPRPAAAPAAVALPASAVPAASAAATLPASATPAARASALPASAVPAASAAARLPPSAAPAARASALPASPVVAAQGSAAMPVSRESDAVAAQKGGALSAIENAKTATQSRGSLERARVNSDSQLNVALAASQLVAAAPTPAQAEARTELSRSSAAPASPTAAPVESEEDLPPSAAAQLKHADQAPRRRAAPAESDDVAKELKLIQAAQLALRAGDPPRALKLLAEHTWSFPQGQLAEARDVARVIALCQAGHEEESKLEAKRFLQQRPDSPYVARVREGCTKP